MKAVHILANSLLILVFSCVLVSNAGDQTADVVKTNLYSMCELQIFNPYAPEQEYAGRVIEVQESVVRVLKNGNILVDIPRFTFIRNILACKNISNNQLAKLRPGDRILVRGLYKSITLEDFSCTIQLKNCEIDNKLEAENYQAQEEKDLIAPLEEYENLLSPIGENEESKKELDFESLLSPDPSSTIDSITNSLVTPAAPEPAKSMPWLFIIIGALTVISSYWNFHTSRVLPMKPEIVRNPVTNTILALCSIATLALLVYIFVKDGYKLGVVAVAISVFLFWLTKRILVSSSAKK